MNEEVKALERIKDITMRGDMSLGGRIACIQSIAHDTLRTRAPASCPPDVVALIAELRAVRCTPKANAWPPKPLKRFELAEQAADALESMMREKDAMREALRAIIDRGPERDPKWAGMTARDIAMKAIARAALDMTVDKGE